MYKSLSNEISLIEKESIILQIRNRQNTGKFFAHNYNIRFPSKFRKLYVDLSKCRIEPSSTEGKREENSGSQNELELFTRAITRTSSTASRDSREFDFTDYTLPKSNFSVEKLMDEPVRCRGAPRPQPQTVWWKYFSAICVLGILYIYIVAIHNGELIRKLQQDVKALKHDARYEADSESKFYRMENTVNNMKREQELSRQTIKNIINQEIMKFGSDKTGRPDFALETSGGRIISLSSDTKNFDYDRTIFGLPLCEGMQGPRAMLQADMSPGRCWAFKGSFGGVVIKLIGKVVINGITVEHISENISPTGDVTSAPKDLAVWGLKSTTDRGQQLGHFTYDIDGPLVQSFSITNSNVYEFVEFRVLSNHGNPTHTCVYRFRVHGSLEKA
ncbi:hypothetical protein JTB14_029214 [Gonioctena quinquepunctata]|nr:hypothetical protein JTB14_029214 [Gonioctena quinquepunctata]